MYRFDDFAVDPGAFRITKGGRLVPIEPKAFDLLRYFLEHPNRIITKQELLDAIWTDVEVTESALARGVTLVRRALGDDVHRVRYVETVPTRGYRFIAQLATVSPSPSTETLPLATVDGISHAVTTPDPLPITIAVLPFVNASQESENEHFSDGISEDILNVLVQDSALRIAARSSSFAFKGKDTDLRTIAEQLHVRFVLEGRVRRTGNRVRISAQLVEVESGYQLWSERFDRDLVDIFAVQDEIAEAVAATTRNVLRHKFGVLPTDEGPAWSTTRRRRTGNLEAYEAFLKGRYLSHQRFVVMREARTCFERAIAIDATFAAAYAALAENYGLCGFYAGLPAVEAFVGMRRYAEDAQALDPSWAEPHYLLASVALWFEWNPSGCERHLRQALAREPYHAGALTLRALLHAVRREREQAWEVAELALRVDPVGVETRTWVIAVAYLTGDIPRQIAEADRLIAEHPGYSEAYRWRSMAFGICGEFARGRADLESFAASTNGHIYALVGRGVIAAREGRTAEVRQIIDEMQERASREYVPLMVFGQVEQQLGNYDSALDWYERAYQTRDFLLALLHIDPQFKIVAPGKTRPITEEPRWTALIKKIGVAP